MVDLAQQIECVTREFKRRRKVFPLLVEQGRMTQEDATAELARMDAVRQTLAQLAGLLGAPKKKGGE